MPLTSGEVDSAIPVTGIPNRSLTNAAVKALIVDVAAKAPLVHTHAIADVTSLQASLDAKAASSHTHASTAISDSTSAGRSMLTAADVAAQTALLNPVTSALKGLAPASGGGTTNYLRADGTWAAPAGGAGGTWGSITGTLSSQTDLQTALDAKASILAPVTLSANTSLTAAVHGNRTIYVDTAGLTLTINNDGTGGWTTDDSLDIQAIGSGTFTLVQGSATLSTLSGTSADSTTAVGKRVQAQRTGTSTWSTISSVVVSASGNTRTLATATTYTIVDDTVDNTVTSLSLGNLSAGTVIDVTMIVEATAGVASNGTFRFDINSTEVTMLAMPETTGATGRIYRFTIGVKTNTSIYASWDLLLDNSFATDPFANMTTTVSDVSSGATLRLRSVRTSTGKVIKVQLLNAVVKQP
jgi:hypothetical protein